ncbi:MAG: hypothetical protein RLN86_03060 [Cyclobacteriaceae bacterium]
MITCSTHKRCYPTTALAEEALIGAHVHFEYGKGKRPVGIYHCENCGQYHLTSQGEVNPKLQAMLKEGEIQKQKEAQWWEGRFKRR